MKVVFRSAIILLAVAAIVLGIAGAATANQVTVGQVVAVQDWTLYVRTSSGEPVSFNPYWEMKERSAVVVGIAKNVLPALASGEVVRVTWTMDEREGRRRIDAIEVISPIQGITKGIVANLGPNQLTIRPKDEPGTVVINPAMVQIERKWVPDPKVVQKLAAIKPGTRVTVSWYWDREGRKRIADVAVGW